MFRVNNYLCHYVISTEKMLNWIYSITYKINNYCVFVLILTYTAIEKNDCNNERKLTLYRECLMLEGQGLVAAG